MDDTEYARWQDRTLVALGDFSRGVNRLAAVQQVAARFAHRFAPADRVYLGPRPHWHQSVDDALAALGENGLVQVDRGRYRLTDSGREALDAAAERLTAEPHTPEEPSQQDEEPLGPPDTPQVVAGVISAPMRTAEGRRSAGIAGEGRLPVMIELNLRFAGGPGQALEELQSLWQRVTGRDGPRRLAEEYATGDLTLDEMKCLVAADAAPIAWPRRTIFRIWPDFEVRKLIDASVATVKADAARRSFNSQGEGIVWAVLDSGIDGTHPHFHSHDTLTHDSVAELHRSFVPPAADGTVDDPLVDEEGHGTHVAAVIAGSLASWDKPVVVSESRYNVENPREPLQAPRAVSDPTTRLAGVAPMAKLVSLKVLGGGGTLESRVSRVIEALAYVREVNANSDKLPRIHGVNLSVGYDFDPTWFACGRSPLCQEVDKLVRTGVVVVVAAGNSGYGTLNPKLSTVTQFGLGMTINDPGNADRAITVGATHRDAPHTYGVSYFSSKGPTGDGRRKPDLVAPGERITSAAAGQLRAPVMLTDEEKEAAVYIEQSGTSMAAPHVSGCVAAFLSVRHEFIGRPEEVKQVFVTSATPLGRDPNFEGGGLIDLMRALQSV